MKPNWLLLCILAVIVACALPTSASAATQCVGGYCYAPSTDMPNASGPYGVVWGGAAQEPIYDYINNAWVNLPGHLLTPGTLTWVAPYMGQWRWVYTQHLQWCLIDANHLWLRWPAS